MTVARLEPRDFETAVRVMTRRGWAQGASVGPGGAVCAARALNIAVAARTNGCSAPMNEAARWLGLHVAVAAWNDEYSTTFDKVRARFLDAARRMRHDLILGGEHDERDDT
jgi:hypothetical protein